MVPPLHPTLPNVLKKRGKYATMTLQKKVAIIKLIKNGRTQANVAKEFKLRKQTLSGYIKNKAKILSAFEGSHGKEQKNDRKGEHPELEEALQL
ncbi:hypothetical protein HPB47_026677 [Ixodes persulcatus]|uniref:Uncharacterized protein n=1 Tax=Ixodes persulcatus TaxID=34615 RepID=A0AC60PY34_IXOPE|nr:hypothetical protein HPB47_026677 [Ixodes persulcatus]